MMSAETRAGVNVGLGFAVLALLLVTIVSVVVLRLANPDPGSEDRYPKPVAITLTP